MLEGSERHAGTDVNNFIVSLQHIAATVQCTDNTAIVNSFEVYNMMKLMIIMMAINELTLTWSIVLRLRRYVKERSQVK